jgi:hypothetical protein
MGITIQNEGEKIEKFCKENNISVSEVLRKANVSGVTVDNWKKQRPKSFQMYDAIMESAEKLILEKTAETAV